MILKRNITRKTTDEQRCELMVNVICLHDATTWTQHTIWYQTIERKINSVHVECEETWKL